MGEGVCCARRNWVMDAGAADNVDPQTVRSDQKCWVLEPRHTSTCVGRLKPTRLIAVLASLPFRGWWCMLWRNFIRAPSDPGEVFQTLSSGSRSRRVWLCLVEGVM